MSWLERIHHDHQALLEAIVEALPEPFFLLDREGRYVAVLGGVDNERYHDGTPLVGKRMHDVLPTATADEFLRCVHRALDTGRPVNHEYQLSSDDVDGVERRPGVPDHLWFEGHIAPLAAAPGRADMVVWLIFNVTESRTALQRLEEQREVMERQQTELERLARIDHLTELLNRRSFFDEASRELHWVARAHESAALIMFDLDDFKTVNDTWGHAAGDAVLREVGRLLIEQRRGSDVIGRLGGEEFALVVRGAGPTDGRRAAERLRDALAALVVEHDGATISVTGSFGVTTLHPDDRDPDEAVKRADRAMYLAKRGGRNRVAVDTSLHHD